MATNGVFTYYDLYGGKPETYHIRNYSQVLSSSEESVLSISTTTIASFPTTVNFLQPASSTTIQPSNKLYKLAQLVPFAYFDWLLIGLAILLALLLIIIFTYYWRTHCRKNGKSRNEKKPPLPNFYRFRASNRGVHGNSIYESTVPLSFPSPARPCPSKSTEKLNHQLLREGLDAVGSPQNQRLDVSRTETPSAFTSTASDLLSEIKSRLSARSSDSASPKFQRLYETQRAKMALHDESKDSSLLIDMS